MRNIFKKVLLITQLISILNPSIKSFATSTLDRYEELSGNYLSIIDNKDVGSKEVLIEGNTLINLLENTNNIDYTVSNLVGEGEILNENTNNRGTPRNKAYLDTEKDYSLFAELRVEDLISNGENTYISPQIKFIYSDGTVGYQNFETVIKSNGIYRIKTKINIEKNIDKLYLNVVGSNIESTYVILGNSILLEGNYNEDEIKVVKDMESVGEKTKSLKLSSSKKLFDLFKRDLGFNPTASNITIEDNLIEYDAPYNFVRVSYNPFYFEEGKKYTIAIKGNNSRVLFMNGNRLNSTPITSNNTTYKTFTAKDGAYTYYIENGERGVCRVRIEDVWIYEGEYDERKHVSRSEYKEMEIPLKEPLRGIKNVNKDRIVKMNNNYYIERNLGQVTFDGSADENWYIAGIYSKYIQIDIPNAKPDAKAVSNRLPYKGIINAHENNPIAMSFVRDPKGVRLKPFEKNDMTLNEGREWLKENPITIIYELDSPIYEKINANLDVYLHEGDNYIQTNSNLPINMKVTIDRTANIAFEAIELAKINPTLENLSKARMWINLLEESIKKDELQEEINNITNIEGLEIEKKNITSNMDVYIKSENMLLMSLSTNSITFDNYSGVDDMELNNAVNISINSSLPYQLNSYLLSEIENSDKSNRIEKDLLNIKLSKDSNYKTFADINEKLILEDDCDAGNNKSHSIDLKLKGSQAHKADIYKTVIKFEAEQK